MRLWTLIVGLVFVLPVSTVMAQLPTASDEHKILRLEQGEWDAAVTMFVGPAGPYDHPVKSTGKESNRMIGDFWIVSDFSGDFGGMSFTGQGQFGYDANKKKYIGTWIDSLSPSITKMVGSYDADSKTMTYETSGMGMDGNPSKGKNVVIYEGKDKRTMAMYMAMPGEEKMMKVMEIVYTRAQADK